MSFTKTISVFAALASIFGAGAAGWKLAQNGQTQDTTVFEQKITELEKQVEQAKQQPIDTNPPEPVNLPQPTVQTEPQPTTLPPVTPPPPVPENVTP